MSQYINHFIRVRPAGVGTDLATGTSLSVAAKSVTVKRENEPAHEVDGVLDNASQAAAWDTVGEKAVDVAVGGSHSVIGVFGESLSGKTYTVLGDGDGFVYRIAEKLAGNADANLTVVLLHHDSVQDLAKPAADNLKIKVDDATGPSVEGATTVRIPDMAAVKSHLEICTKSRDEIAAKSFDSMLSVAYVFGTGAGSVTVIECCGSERALHAGATPDQMAENKARLKALLAYQRCWLDAAINADPKAIAFKDAKICRFVQAGLSAAMDAKGYAAQVVCLRNVSEALLENCCNATYAESCVKQEGLKSVSEYKEKIEFLEERMDVAEKEKVRLQQEAKAAEAAALKAKVDHEAKLKELEEEKGELAGRVNAVRQQCTQEIERLKKTLDTEKQAHAKKQQEEVERMRNMATNAPQLAEQEVKRRLEELAKAHEEKVASIKSEIDQLTHEIKENKELLQDLEALKKEREEQERAAMKPVREMEKELSKLQAELSTAGKSREDGLSAEQISENQRLWEARDELDDIEEDITKLALECMMLENGLENKLGEPSESSESSSDSDSDSESDSDSDSDSDSSETPSEAEARAAKMAEEIAKEKQEEKEKVDRAAFEKEYAYFRECLKKEQFLLDLVEKIICYLEYGTNVSLLTDKGFSRHFVYLAKDRTHLGIIGEVAEGAVPNKKSPQRLIKLDDVAAMVLGQHSPTFQHFLKSVSGRVDPPRTEQPPTAEQLTPNNMHRYYYRAFSMRTKKDDWLDVISDTQTDFEALVVALHRLTRRDALWGKKLYIDFCEQVDDLKSFERKFCEESHLTPQQYLSAKEKVLMNEELLYITLHDIRLLTSLDLYHAQRMLEMFMTHKWVVRRQLNYFKYQEKLEKSAGNAAARLGFRDPNAADPDDLI